MAETKLPYPDLLARCAEVAQRAFHDTYPTTSVQWRTVIAKVLYLYDPSGILRDQPLSEEREEIRGEVGKKWSQDTFASVKECPRQETQPDPVPVEVRRDGREITIIIRI